MVAPPHWATVVAAWFLPTPRTLWRRLLAGAIVLKGRSPMQTLTLTLAILRTVLAAVKVEEAVRTAPDTATRRQALADGVPPLVESLATAFGAPAGSVASIITPEVVGELFDLEEVGRGLLEARVPQVDPAAVPV